MRPSRRVRTLSVPLYRLNAKIRTCAPKQMKIATFSFVSACRAQMVSVSGVRVATIKPQLGAAFV